MYSQVTNQWVPASVLCVHAWATEQTRRLERSPDLDSVVIVETRALHQYDIHDLTKYTYQMPHELFTLCWSSVKTISNKMYEWKFDALWIFVCINISPRQTQIAWMIILLPASNRLKWHLIKLYIFLCLILKTGVIIVWLLDCYLVIGLLVIMMDMDIACTGDTIDHIEQA